MTSTEPWMPTFEPLSAARGFGLRMARLFALPRRPVRRKARRPRRQRKPIFVWLWTFDGRRGFVEAASRCDARSLIKHELGIRIKHRLPVGVEIRKSEVVQG